MNWQPDEEKVIELLAKAFPEWVQPSNLHERLGISQDRFCVIMRLLSDGGLLENRATGLKPTAKAIDAWRQIQAARATAEKDRRNLYKRARNWCETHWVSAIIMILFTVVGAFKGLVDIILFLWKLWHPSEPPTP